MGSFMNYKFKAKENLGDILFLVETNETNKIVSRFTDFFWTPHKIQEIINGVEDSRASEDEDSFIWSSEDVYLRGNKHGVFFLDLIGKRANKGLGKHDYYLSHIEFLQFLEDFKKFIKKIVNRYFTFITVRNP